MNFHSVSLGSGLVSRSAVFSVVGMYWNLVRLANSKAGIKPTAPLPAFDKENSIEFPLDSVRYLYKQSNPNPVFYPALPYESTCSRTSVDIKRKEKKRKSIFKGKKRKGKEKEIMT